MDKIKVFTSKLEKKYSAYNNFYISKVGISFNVILADKKNILINKLINKPNLFLFINIVPNIFCPDENSKIFYSIQNNKNKFNYDINNYVHGSFDFQIKIDPLKFINTLDYFIEQTQNYISNIDITNAQSIKIFNSIEKNENIRDYFIKYSSKPLASARDGTRRLVALNFEVINSGNMMEYIESIINSAIKKEISIKFLHKLLFKPVLIQKIKYKLK